MMLLLDVNALLAMSYRDHVHHKRLETWVSQLTNAYGNDNLAFATCPITELGFVRIASGVAGYAATLSAARSDLQDLRSRHHMLFIPDDLRTLHLPGWVCKPAQTTDGYLLALAKSHSGYLATLDRFIPDAVLISEENPGPWLVRDEAIESDFAALSLHRAFDQEGARGIVIR